MRSANARERGLDSRLELAVDAERPRRWRARAARPCGRRGSGRGRPETTSSSSREPFAKRGLDVVCRRLRRSCISAGSMPEGEQRAREKRPGPVLAVAADELRAGDDDRRADLPAQSGCTPLGVTVSAWGRYPRERDALAAHRDHEVFRRADVRARSACRRTARPCLARSFPGRGSSRPGPPMWTATYDGPLTAAIWEE